MAAITQVLQELQEKLQEEEPRTNTAPKPAEDGEADWNKLKPDESWKKNRFTTNPPWAINPREAEFTQYRKPVGAGPSGNTWPK